MKFRKTALACTVAAVELLASEAGHAQSQDSPAAGNIDEIVVTAQKSGSETLQDVPISISVLSGDKLDTAGVSSVNDAIGRLPGVAVYETFQGNGSKFSIRGVSASPSIFSGSGTAAYYMDEVPFALVKTPLTPDANAYDLDRVEVLKGPQGTLYGASALAGVVRVLTKDANVDAFEAKAQGGVSSTEHGGDNYKGDVAVNVPLITGKLAIRAVASYEDLSGWVDRPAVPEKDYNGSRTESYRVKVAARPTERFTANLSAWISRSNLDGLNSSTANMTLPTVRDESTLTEYQIYGLNLAYSFDSFSIEAPTSYIDYKNDGDFEVSAVESQRTVLDAQTFTQELRAYSTTDGVWSWSVGASYRNAEDSRLVVIPVTYSHDAIDANKSESVAVYGEVGRKFADERFELRGGLRYFHDDVSLEETDRLTGITGEPIDSSSTFEKTTPRVVLSWFPSSRHTLYASYSQGFRSGFEQSGDAVAAAPGLSAVKPDLLTNYEIGAKGSAGVVSYEVATYYQSWQDPQVRQFVNIGTGAVPVYIATPSNGTDANGLGIDATLNFRITRGLTLGGSASWNDLSFSKDVYARTLKIYNKGDRLDESPELTGSLYADYGFDFGSTGYAGHFSTDVNYVSKLTTKNEGTGAVFEGDDVTTASMSFTVTAPYNWSARFFVDNLTDEDGVVRPTTSIRQYLVSRMRPRTVGVLFSYKY
ncbi:TonB-dependent receptor [Steroidobacter flavus]|uniref:TonB-dependent receptor n=1 Tax=Steroidobacter flavus TaxID=1842136 RepID=A0ABV8T413_9GAMM